MKINEKVLIGVSVGVIGLTLSSAMLIGPIYRGYKGYSEEGRRRIVGTVLAESYKNTLSPVGEYNGLVSYSNETVKLDSKYTLKIKTDEGKILGVSIIDNKPFGTETKESLDALINRGTRISFPRGENREDETFFTDDAQMGTKRANKIEVWPKE